MNREVARIEIDDKGVDPTWLELTLEDIWDQVKAVRKTRGPRERTYFLSFGATTVEIKFRRTSP